MPTLSLCMIVKDEESNLRRLLSSVSGIFDQICVVDTGSTDKTKEVAAEFGCEVYDFTRKTHPESFDEIGLCDFAAARNFSFSKCKSEYVSWLDADDEILPAHKKLWLEMKPKLGLADTYLMAYDYAQDAAGKSLCRIFRHRILRFTPDVKWKWIIHECLTFPPDWSECVTNIVVTHRRGEAENERDKGRNIRLLAKALIVHPDEPRLIFYFAKECFAENMNDESIAAFERYLKTKGDWHDNIVNAHFILAMAYWRTKQEDKVIEQCMRGIALDPRWAEFYNTIGQVHLEKERWGQAIPWFEISAKLKPPEVFGTVLPENYTWIPHDRLACCYMKMGRIQEALEACERALRFNSDERILSNREYCRNILYPGRLTDRPTRLSLGSGGKHTLSYRCTDMFPARGVEELIDQSNIPYQENSVHAIYSEHALEHAAGHSAARASLAEWARVLKHGGYVELRLPDLEGCCELYLRSEDRERNPEERWTEKEWYRYCLYGIQDVAGNEHPEGQYHRTGFSKSELRRELEKNGFEVSSIENYDGYGTPSMLARATQVKKPIRIAWMIPGLIDQNHGSLRIRRLNVHSWLRNNGVDSRIIDYQGRDAYQEASGADVCVFISFGLVEKVLIERLRRRGVKIIFDHCEDLHDLPHQVDCYQMADVISCCSTILASKAQIFGRTICLPDAYETT